MPKFVFDPKKERELGGLLDVLIHSEAIHCKAVAPEVVFSGVNSYLIHGYDHQVIVDFNKMAKALYDSGYRKGEKTMKTTVGGLVDKIDAIESLIQDLRKIDIDTTNKAADYLWDYLTMIRSEQVEI